MRPTPAHAFANAIVGGLPDRERYPQRELVLTVPLPEDRGRRGDARPKVHRFRSYEVELGRRQRVEALVAGRLWPELRAAVIAVPGMPARWAAAVRWYRRASRERARRATEGAAIAALLEDLRDTHRPDVLRQRYAAAGAGWGHGAERSLAPITGPGVSGAGGAGGAALRRIEDAAFGLRWLEIARGTRFDPSRSLV